MKKILLSAILALILAPALRADEGMWLLPFIKQLNLKDMKAEGFKLSAEDISNINNNAIKDAVVIFGNGCTGEIVSSEGLLLTNHHCGYGAIQQHSSVEHDYLKDGFWAMTRAEEIPTPGLTVTFIRKIIDVTDKIIPQLNDKMTETERSAKIDALVKEATKGVADTTRSQRVMVRDMFGGNQFFMFVMEVYRDVRMVGTPPSSVGKFGGDTDNWMWPRHTGDFSVFRVYSDKDGKPAAYSPDNVPYKSTSHLKISTKGVKEDDFAMIIGFPGSTQRYMTSWEIDYMLSTDNPVRIFIRGERQKLMMEDMLASDKVRIQYSSKYASSSNYWKNSIGMSRGITKLNVKGQKEAIEAEFGKWLAANPDKKAKYGDALPLIEKSVTEKAGPAKINQYLSEALLRGVEIISQGFDARALLRADSVNIDAKTLDKMKQSADDLYKDYSPSTDRKIARRMVRIVIDSLPKEALPSFVGVIDSKFGGNSDAYVDYIYDNSILASQEKYEAFLASPSREKLEKDPGMAFARSVLDAYNGRIPQIAASATDYYRGHRLFIAGLMEMQPSRKFYPDANFTMRMTYGQVLPYRPADGVIYDYYTTLSGVIAKEDPANAYEFTVPEKLKDLYAKKDFGPYAHNGDVPVCFLSNNDITGGNSGSPVMNGKGELIGLAFDGNWEAMSGDIAFEPALQRTISVDIRYVLFIIDKYAGAGHLVREMTLVGK